LTDFCGLEKKKGIKQEKEYEMIGKAAGML